MGSAKGLCNRQDTQRCTSGRIGMDGNSVMISRIKRRKTMTDRLILTILVALACPLLLPIVIEEEAEEEDG